MIKKQFLVSLTILMFAMMFVLLASENASAGATDCHFKSWMEQVKDLMTRPPPHPLAVIPEPL